MSVMKVILATAVKNWAAFLKPEDLDLKEDCRVVYDDAEGVNWCRLRIRDVNNVTRVFEIKVREVGKTEA